MAACAQMEDAGLIERRALPGRNKTGLTLTGLGSERLDASCQVEVELAEHLLEGISQDDREVFMKVLRQATMRVAMSDMAGAD